jgi:hypothetical protein
MTLPVAFGPVTSILRESLRAEHTTVRIIDTLPVAFGPVASILRESPRAEHTTVRIIDTLPVAFGPVASILRKSPAGGFPTFGYTGLLPFPPLPLAVGFVDLLLLLSPAATISTALRLHSLGFSNRCKNKQLISLCTRLNTSTPFEKRSLAQ